MSNNALYLSLIVLVFLAAVLGTGDPDILDAIQLSIYDNFTTAETCQ